MKLVNTSRLPDAAVKRLVAFACRGLNMADVAVHVRHSSSAYAGRAYSAVPLCSPERQDKEIRYLMTARVGGKKHFPADNMVTKWSPWNPYSGSVKALPKDAQFRTGTRNFQPLREARLVLGRQPYGGKTAPYMLLADPYEALVAIAAHEARHIYQYREGKPRSEKDAETWANKRLLAFRADRERLLP